MTAHVLADFYERDLRKLIGEISQFKNEENLWKTLPGISNSCGNLALHIVGGSNYLIGNKLANTGYIRNRNLEFSSAGMPRKDLVTQLEELILLVAKTIKSQNLESDFPIPFDDAIRTKGYVLTQLALHLNYHLGQINYLRRLLEPVT